MDLSIKNTTLITCAKGLVPYLTGEVEALGFKADSSHKTGIEIKASLYDMMLLNIRLRTAFNVLYLLKEFRSETPQELYDNIYELAWDDIIPADEYVSVVSQTDTSAINNSIFASQKAKDAICDKILKSAGKRPDSGPERDNCVINLYWKDDRTWVYLNTSGNKLSDRTYRKLPYEAPMQETLAAAAVLATGYTGQSHFVNPMTGSGTLAIEAALIALGRPPGLLRNNFGIQHIKGFDNDRWQALRKDSLKLGKKSLQFKIIATDNSSGAIEAARKNAMTAGVDQFIEFKICDYAETPIPDKGSVIMLNSPYGLRMGDIRELENLYKGIGDFFKQKCAGSRGYIFTGNMELAKKVGLKTKRRLEFFNAEIECRLLEYEMYEGSKTRDIPRQAAGGAGA